MRSVRTKVDIRSNDLADRLANKNSGGTQGAARRSASMGSGYGKSEGAGEVDWSGHV